MRQLPGAYSGQVVLAVMSSGLGLSVQILVLVVPNSFPLLEGGHRHGVQTDSFARSGSTLMPRCWWSFGPDSRV